MRIDSSAFSSRCLRLMAPMLNCYHRGGRRAVDVLVSGAALCVAWPLMAVIAVVIRLTMGSPVLFRQVRPGLHERIFTILKFRTMTEACGPDGELLPPETRITWLGRLLRTASLDELPELWNVLRGDMSLVGPRPWLPKYLPLYSDFQKRRHEVSPGITGLAQVRGRNRLSWDERIALDVWYVDHCGFLMDCAIVARTVWRVLARKDVGEGAATTSQEFRGGAACAGGSRGHSAGAAQ